MKTKKIIAMLTVMCLVLGLIPISAVPVLAAEYGTEVLIEAEALTLGNSTHVATAKQAGGGKCIVNTADTEMKNAVSTATPDLSVTINVEKFGYYAVVMRYSARNTGSDSYNIRWDGAEYEYVALPVTGAEWGWAVVHKKLLFPGKHTLDILHREMNMYLDCFIVTADPDSVDTDAIEDQISQTAGPQSPQIAVDSTAPTFNARDGAVMFEAEDAYCHPDYFEVGDDLSASGLKYASPTVTTHSTISNPSVDLKGYEFNFYADTTSPSYNIWARVSVANGGQDSIWFSYDGSAYGQLSAEFAPTDGYEWRKLKTVYTVEAGTKHNVRLFPREAGAKVDKFIITKHMGYVPVEMGDLSVSGTSALPDMYSPEILPPKGVHPRLLFREEDIPSIKESMNHTENEKALAAYNAALARITDGSIGGLVVESSTNYNESILATIEAYAFKYALDKDESYGRKAISSMIKYLNSATFDPDGQDVTRPMGHTIFVASEVYDWCYDLLEPKQKTEIILLCEGIASGMEVGWPPKYQGAVCGHGGEMQLFRDLVSFGIATYDERPDIYDYVGGRLLDQFIVTRDFWYQANNHHQGSAYGSYRFACEIVYSWIMYRMTGGERGGVHVFDDAQGQVMYYYLYNRRPDGQVLRDGDDYNENTSRGHYWNIYWLPMFYAGNYYKDEFIKGEYAYEGSPISDGTYTLSGVHHLLFNDVTVAANTDKSSLPLSRYFGSPSGMMIARTGWDINPSNPSASNDVVAMMKIGEMWGANHHHLDAGNFQIYYKGILASESGFYESYGTKHDGSYNKRSIAHNVLTIYDPDEKFNAYTATAGGNINDGGQRWPNNAGEPATWQIWNNGQYKTGTVLDHAIGPDTNKPEYTYIKGDITDAYSDKVSKVQRSMVFMPLEDANYPAMMVIMDKVTSANASFKKKWLLHTQQEPEISGNTTIVKRDTDGYNGKLTVQTLLPENASVTKVGGQDKQFWVGNQNGDFLNDGVNLATKGYSWNTTSAIEYGWGRVEVSPSSANLSDTFLNVLAVSDATNTAKPLDSKLIRTQGFTGVQTAGKVLLFADVDTPVSEKNRYMGDKITFTADSGNKDILIMGVQPGKWNVYGDGSFIKTVYVSQDGGEIYFSSDAVSFELTKADELTIKTASAEKNNHVIGVTATIEGPATTDTEVHIALYNASGNLIGKKRTDYTGSGTYYLGIFDEKKTAVKVKVFVTEKNKIVPVTPDLELGIGN